MIASSERTTLAFTNFSVEDYGFPISDSLEILEECIYEFFSRSSNLQLLLVELPFSPRSILRVEEEPVTSRVRCLQNSFNGRFNVIEADIASLRTKGGISNVRIVANPSNNRFSDKGGYVNQLIHKNSGGELTELATKLFPCKIKGHAYPIPLSETNPLRVNEGYEYVILVLGPNLRPDKPDCERSLDDARDVLRSCYRSLFNAFQAIVEDSSQILVNKSTTTTTTTATTTITTGTKEDSSQIISPSNEPICISNSIPIEVEVTCVDIPNNPSHWTVQEVEQVKDVTTVSVYDPTAALSHRPPSGPFNRDILYSYLQWPLPPHLHTSLLLRDAHHVAVYDAYPKAHVHVLFMLIAPLHPPAQSVLQLHPDHAECILSLHSFARAVAGSSAVVSAAKGRRLRLGYHAVPSLRPLHLHLISNDMDSACMKTKLHWNSFTTDFFVNVDDVEKALLGPPACHLLRPEAFYESCLDTALRCHGCGAACKNMPKLKSHIVTCASIY